MCPSHWAIRPSGLARELYSHADGSSDPGSPTSAVCLSGSHSGTLSLLPGFVDGQSSGGAGEVPVNVSFYKYYHYHYTSVSSLALFIC